MRPDRLVVGEVRGAEICDLLTAMNTGHEGGCGTVHANSPADVPARLEALAALGGLPRAALHAQLASALDAVVHVSRGELGRRRVGGDLGPRDATARPAWSPASVRSPSAPTEARSSARVARGWRSCSAHDDAGVAGLRAAGSVGRARPTVGPATDQSTAGRVSHRAACAAPAASSGRSPGLLVAGDAVAAGVWLAGARGAVLALAGDRGDAGPCCGWSLNTSGGRRPCGPRPRSRGRAIGWRPICGWVRCRPPHWRPRPPTVRCCGRPARFRRWVAMSPGSGALRRGAMGRRGSASWPGPWRVAIDTGAPMSAMLQQVATGLSADQDLRSVVSGELVSPGDRQGDGRAAPVRDRHRLPAGRRSHRLAGGRTGSAGPACSAGFCWPARASSGSSTRSSSRDVMVRASRVTGSGWLALSPTAVVAVLLSGLAAYLGLRHPRDQLRRTSAGGGLRASRRCAGGPRVRGSTGRPVGEPAPVDLPGAGALCLVLVRVHEGPGVSVWFAWPVVAVGGALALGWLEPLSFRRRQRDSCFRCRRLSS